MARETVPEYGVGSPVSTASIHRLLDACSMQVLRADMGIPADAWPPLGGVVYVFVDVDVGPPLLRYVSLHEIGHRLAGDLDEPTAFVFDGPLPEAEEVADIFALMGILDQLEIEQGPEFVEALIRDRVPHDGRGWVTHRVPRLSQKIVDFARFFLDRAAE